MKYRKIRYSIIFLFLRIGTYSQECFEDNLHLAKLKSYIIEQSKLEITLNGKKIDAKEKHSETCVTVRNLITDSVFKKFSTIGFYSFNFNVIPNNNTFLLLYVNNSITFVKILNRSTLEVLKEVNKLFDKHFGRKKDLEKRKLLFKVSELLYLNHEDDNESENL